MKKTYSATRVDVSVEPAEGPDGNSKVHHIEIKFHQATAVNEIATGDGTVSFTICGQSEWDDLKACLKEHFA